jgi:hypothetical protein
MSQAVIPKPRRVDGYLRVPFRNDEDIWRATLDAFRAVLEEAEPGGFEMLDYFPDELRAAQLAGISIRVVRVVSTLYPEYRFADIEISGDSWVDYDGETVVFYGADDR